MIIKFSGYICFVDSRTRLEPNTWSSVLECNARKVPSQAAPAMQRNVEYFHINWQRCSMMKLGIFQFFKRSHLERNQENLEFFTSSSNSDSRINQLIRFNKICHNEGCIKLRVFSRTNKIQMALWNRWIHLRSVTSTKMASCTSTCSNCWTIVCKSTFCEMVNDTVGSKSNFYDLN